MPKTQNDPIEHIETLAQPARDDLMRFIVSGLQGASKERQTEADLLAHGSLTLSVKRSKSA